MKSQISRYCGLAVPGEKLKLIRGVIVSRGLSIKVQLFHGLKLRVSVRGSEATPHWYREMDRPENRVNETRGRN